MGKKHKMTPEEAVSYTHLDHMKAYELLFFVDPNLDPETRLAVMKRIDNTIAEGNGKVDTVDEWGKRKLAYEIDKLTEGDYTPVSYTHLDVYKRQPVARLARARSV